MKTPRIAIATGGKSGDALYHKMNRSRGDGTMKYGITVMRPMDPMTGNRWDVILLVPPGPEITQTELEVFKRWCVEYLPTKLKPDGEIIRLGDFAGTASAKPR